MYINNKVFACDACDAYKTHLRQCPQGTNTFIYIYIYIHTSRKVYDRNVVNKYRIHFVLGDITFKIIHYVHTYGEQNIGLVLFPQVDSEK